MLKTVFIIEYEKLQNEPILITGATENVHFFF